MSKYDELYNRIRKEIISEQWLPGAKLPSIRKAAAIYGVSRTTIQNAYFALAADGFIISEHIKKQKKQTKPSIQAKAISYTI